MNLPEVFIERTLPLLGTEFESFRLALEQQAPTSIRINDKTNYIPSEEKVAWCDSGYYLPERPLFTSDPLFHAGAYYVQEASSMFLSQAVKQHFANAQTVLDLCAAPGGKSTLLSQTLSSDCLLVSNEVIRSRSYILAENMIKWGNPNCVVTNNEAADFGQLEAFFDAIVIDAPCSGEGMFRKDPGAINEWSVQNVKTCAERQKNIVNQVWDALKADGILVYSTCTYNREENEENVAWICEELGADVLQIDTQSFPNITVTENGYRFYPHKTKGEGFFLSVLRKSNGKKTYNKKNKENRKGIKLLGTNQLGILQLQDQTDWIVEEQNNQIHAYDSRLYSHYTTLTRQLRCLHSGILLGETKGKDTIPSISIAMSKRIERANIICYPCSYAEAIAYLKKETLNMPNTPKGYVLVCYKNLALGWVKNIGSRTNNMYPQEWRIRMNL